LGQLQCLLRGLDCVGELTGLGIGCGKRAKDDGVGAASRVCGLCGKQDCLGTIAKEGLRRGGAVGFPPVAFAIFSSRLFFWTLAIGFTSRR
jgi:hypothetical protein